MPRWMHNALAWAAAGAVWAVALTTMWVCGMVAVILALAGFRWLVDAIG